VLVPTFAIACPDFHPTTCGIGDHSVRLASELRGRGYVAEIFTRAPAEAHPEAPDVPVHGVSGRGPLAIAEQIRRAVIGGGFSHLILQYVPHMWGAWRFGSPATIWLARAARHASVEVTAIAHELYPEFLPRPDLIAAAALQRAQMAVLAHNVDRLFVTTDTRAAELAPLLRAARVHARPGVIRIGPGALPKPRRLVPGRLRIGLFSTLAANKRFDVVLAAFERIWRRHPASELVVIGDVGGRGDRRTAAFYEAVARHPAADRIQLTGRLSLPDAAEQMANLDVYLFPMTTGANTRSSTLPVAFGAGVPVVALRGSNTDEALFHDRDNVLFARALTADAFAAAALEIFDDPELARNLEAGERRLYDQHLAWPVIVDAFLAALGRPAAVAVAAQAAAAT
jgi:glycosyltransferase involved in cell wall biosynthesis